MNTRLFSVIIITLIVLSDVVVAKEIRLKKGGIYQDQDLTVICEGGRGGGDAQALAVQECQYWNDYSKKCSFEKTIYTYNDLECIETCQQWDSYREVCDYQNKCTFYPAQEAFILTTCAEFDDYSRKCIKVREEKVGK